MMFRCACVMLVLAVSNNLTSALPFERAENGTKDELRILSSEAEAASKTVRFLLWTRENPTDFVQLKVGDVSALTDSGFDKNLPTKIYAHGFTMNGQHDLVLDMRDAYLKREPCNFISVDWRFLALAPFYVRAASNTGPVGELTGQLINFLVEQGSDLKNFHVIGFSLGAHVAGKAGATVNGLLPRVTGLDPAAPLFSIGNTDQRLDTTDAEFVDVIHTHSGYLIDTGLSFVDPIGHVDFYPNGGRSQVGCGLLLSGSIVDLIQVCSHNRVNDYFTESINSPVGFNAIQCDTWDNFDDGVCDDNPEALMGEPVSGTTKGVFFLSTNKESSFALGPTN